MSELTKIELLQRILHSTAIYPTYNGKMYMYAIEPWPPVPVRESELKKAVENYDRAELEKTYSDIVKRTPPDELVKFMNISRYIIRD